MADPTKEVIKDAKGFRRELIHLYPDGVVLYHRTTSDAAASILVEGLKPLGKFEVVHTVFGCPHTQRVGGDCLLELSIPVEMYEDLYPEESSYLEHEDYDLYDGDERDDLAFARYAASHQGFIGGDMTLHITVPPKYIAVRAE